MSVRHEQFDVEGPPRLDVRVATGEVTVRDGSPDQVRITLDASDVDQFRVERVGDTITIDHDSRWRLRSRSVRLLIETPPGSGLELATATADVRVTAPLGTARVKTASGDVSIDRAERVEITTASGSCRIGHVGDESRVNAVSGDYTGTTVEGRFTASTASGDIRVGRVGGDVSVATTSGDIRIDHCDGDDITARSVSGDVMVGLPGGITVDADLSTISGRTVLPERRAEPSSAPRRPVRLRMRSVSGDLRVVRVD